MSEFFSCYLSLDVPGPLVDRVKVVLYLRDVSSVCVWGVLKYFHSYLGSDNFGRFKILNFSNFFFFLGGGGVRKINIFWGYEDFVDIFWGHHKNKKYEPPKMVQAYLYIKISEYPPPLIQVGICLEFEIV